MSKKYVIQWKSKMNGRAGRGTKRFNLEEAEGLVNELNQEYPNIHHEILDSESTAAAQDESAGRNIQDNPGASGEMESDKAYEAHAFTE
jgi:hypothetical protein